MPVVLDVNGHIIVAKDGKPANKQQLRPIERVDRFEPFSCELSIYFKYYVMELGSVKPWLSST